MAARRGKRGLGSVYQRESDGRWVVQVTVAGERVVRYAATEGDAEALRAQLLTQAHGGTLPSSDARAETVGAYLTRWLASLEGMGDLEPITVRRYGEHVRLRLIPTLGQHRLAALTSEQVRAALVALRRRGDVGPVTLRATRGTLHLALARAVAEGRLSRNVVASVRGPRVPAQEQVALSRQEAQRLVEAAAGERLGALWLLALYTGAREGELLACCWRDLTLDDGAGGGPGGPPGGRWIVRRVVAYDANRQPFLKERTKRQASMRTLPLLPIVVDALRRHHAQQAAERLAAGPLWHRTDLVFCTGLGTLYSASNLINRDWRRLRDAARLPENARPHSLRHTFASSLLALGRSLPEVAYLLGHANTSVTARTYSHHVPRGGTAALEGLGDYYAPGGPTAPAAGVAYRPGV